MTVLKQITQRLALSGLLFGVVLGAPGLAAAHEGKVNQERAADPSEKPGQITTQGSGEVRVRPDSFRTSVGYEARAASLDQARIEVNTKVQQILQALKALGLPGLTLQTQNLSFSTIYDDKATPPKIIGYSATNSVSATLTLKSGADLGERASRIIDAALKAGANNVGDVDFFARDTKAAQERALAIAVEDAARHARTMAEAAGVRSIKLKELHQAGSFRPLAYRAMSLMAAAPAGGEASTPIEAGELVISSNVNATFEFAK